MFGRWAAPVVLAAVAAFGTGCASPGHPSAPSLQIPRPASNLSATRQGDQVHLRWTTPSRTTDNVVLKAPITADICRTLVTSPARGTPSGAVPCATVQSVVVRSGPSEATDQLPPQLATGPHGLLAYRVQLRGSLGKTEGPSLAAFAASGPPPPAIEDLRLTDTKDGALLQWTPHPAESQAIELTRELVSTATPATPAPARTANPFRTRPGATEPTNPGVTHLSAGLGDSGGALDRSAELGATYRYTAERVLTLVLDTHTLELRSAPSPAVPLTLRDIFPPAAPTALVATPGPGSIDLSWDPATEQRVAGYRVYRADAGAGVNPPGAAEGAAAAPQQWTRLTQDLLTAPAYRDLSGASGHSYRYRVTAVGSSGNESQPSNEVAESAP